LALWRSGTLESMTSVELKEAPMVKPAKDMFDPKIFLAKVGAGKAILEFHKNQNVFEQGDVADTVFYIQKGRVKLTVQSEQARKRSSRSSDPASSSVKAA
jgi:CRP-like cAMP-binding protein